MTPSEREQLDKELAEIVQECSVHDWNGYGAEPINLDSVRFAFEFLEKLSPGISMPELDVSPGGDLWMSWGRMSIYFSITISGDRRIYWCVHTPTSHKASEGENEWNGILPADIFELLHEIEGVRNEYK